MKVYEMYVKIKGTPKWDEGTEHIMHTFDKVLDMLEKAHPDKYREIHNELYIAVNGYHFNEDMLKDSFKTMKNDDGSKAPKWSVKETNDAARSHGVAFADFNEYDWNYTMNMLYSDYCMVLGDNETSYVKMAEKFLDDKDGPDGKALIYSMCMKKDYK